jgi:GrpB-like predicted nucleotidyltransferase (UPF0157 family)
VEILDGPLSAGLADRLRAKDDTGLLTVDVVETPGRAALVLAVGGSGDRAQESVLVDALLDNDKPLDEQIKDATLAPAADYRKRSYVRPDPVHPAILHVRKLGSPWSAYTVRFRDWLWTDPAGRGAYQAAKEQATLARADDPDYDNYTHDKMAFFDQVQHEYDQTSIPGTE